MLKFTSFVTAVAVSCSLGAACAKPYTNTYRGYKPTTCITATTCKPTTIFGNPLLNGCGNTATAKPTPTPTPTPDGCNPGSTTPTDPTPDDATPAPSPSTPTQEPTTQPTPSQEPSQSTTAMDEAAKAVVDMVNEERAKQGLSALTVDETLVEAASIRADEIVSSFAHTRPDGQSCFTVLKDLGYSYTGAGENIAKGQTSAERVMAGWMSSPGHYANIMKSTFTKIGVGHVVVNGVHYWAQMFAR